jgi:hypothetical protein
VLVVINKEKAGDITGKAYSIVHQLLAPDLCGEVTVSDHHKAVACDYVMGHWHRYAQGTMMPDDLREILSYWISRYDELVTNA